MSKLCARIALAAAFVSSLWGTAGSASAAPLFSARPTAPQATTGFAFTESMPHVFETEDAVQAEAAKAAARKAAAERPKPPMRPLRVMATAYALRGHTASGAYTRMGTIAVDPRVIPLGTRLYVPGYGWGLAQDTGGAIRGNVIDLWMPSNRHCFAWGVRTVDILVEVRKRRAPRLLASRKGRPRAHAANPPAPTAGGATTPARSTPTP